MANTTRNLVAGVVMAVALVGAVRREAGEPQDNTTVARPVVGPAGAGVRTERPALGTLIRPATEVSATFRGLAATIEGSNGIVYIELNAKRADAK
jgi:hypothetical protein